MTAPSPPDPASEPVAPPAPNAAQTASAPVPSAVAISLPLLIGAVVILALNLRTPLVAVGPVVGMIREDLGVSGSFVGLVTALPMLAFALFSPLAARLARLWGIENVLIGSSILLAIGIAVRSAFPSAALLVAGTVILSAAIAMGNVLLPALAKRSLPHRVGLIIGAMTFTMSLSAAVAAAVAVPLAHWLNWRWSLGVWITTALLALPVWLYLKRQTPPALPESPAYGQNPTQTPHAAGGLNVWVSPAAWCISAMMGVQSLMFYAMANFLPSVLAEKGMSALEAGAYGSLFQAMSLLGVLGASALFARSRHKQALGLSTALMLVAGIGGIWLGGLGTMWLWVTCVGISGSAMFSVSLMLFALRTDSPQEAAALSGMAQSVGYTIAIFGPLGMGMLYDGFGSWRIPMGVLTAMMVGECALAWAATRAETLSQCAQAAEKRRRF